MIADKIRDLIQRALGDVSGDVKLEHPSDMAHGDYSTNVALVHSVDAKELAAKLHENLPDYIERVDTAGVGFINFYLSQKFFAGVMQDISEDFGKNDALKGQRIIVEYTDPNPFKEFHIGHLLPNIIGESLARISVARGGDVRRVNYQGDVGLHVAKAIYGMIRSGKREFSARELGEAYAFGASEYESNKAEIQEINKKIFDRSDDEINKLYDTGRKMSLDYFETIYKRLGTKFDHYFFESETGKLGKELVENNIGNVFEESDGAVVYPKSKSGLHTRVFLNSNGLPTYEAKELGLAKLKYDWFAYDVSLIVTGNEINEYFAVLLSAMAYIYPGLAEKTIHIGNGMLRLKSGKMSSRTGNVISANELIDEVIGRVRERADNKSAEDIALAAIKYAILKNETHKDIVFDIGESISIGGNSGPYLQYTYARAKSVLHKAGNTQSTSDIDSEVTDVERLLYRFPEVVERAGAEYAPHHICTYLHELAQAFNSYYATNQIAGNAYRTKLTKAVAIVLKNGLELLGIKAPERM